MLLKTKGKYLLSEATSALIKTLRRGLEQEALFWAQELEASFPAHTWKRLAIFCTEDVGLADPDAIVRVMALWNAYDRIKEQQGPARPIEGDILSMAVLLLARAPKHRECDTAKNYMIEKRKQGFALPIPPYALDVHTARGRQAGATEQMWWQDDLWLPVGGHGKYLDYAEMKKRGESLPPLEQGPRG